MTQISISYYNYIAKKSTRCADPHTKRRYIPHAAARSTGGPRRSLDLRTAIRRELGTVVRRGRLLRGRMRNVGMQRPKKEERILLRENSKGKETSETGQTE
jgi:hypothetical protein